MSASAFVLVDAIPPIGNHTISEYLLSDNQENIMNVPITYLTDCTDTNATARIGSRVSALFGYPPLVLPLTGSRPDLLASLTVLDIIYATELTGTRRTGSITLLNLAPRIGKADNGTPFCYFQYYNHLVVSTAIADLFSLVRIHLGIASVYVTDVRSVMDAAARSWASFSESEVDLIVNTQFRSLWFMPLLAKWIKDGRSIPSRRISTPDVSAPPHVQLIDNFGNCKINCTLAGLGGSVGDYVKILTTRDGVTEPTEVKCYRRLTDVPLGEAGLVSGSSCSGFAELVVSGGSAAAEFGLTQGDTLF